MITIQPIYLSGTTLRNALNAAKDKTCTRDDMARFYADILLSVPGPDWDGWKQVNAAIQERWPKGLVYIKERAWRIAWKEAGL